MNKSAKPTTTKRTAAKPKAKQTKEAKVIAAMRRPGGATAEALIKLTGWLPHTLRGVISTLRRKRGFEVEAKREAGKTTYRIIPKE